MRRPLYLLICIALLLFASCGRQQQTKSVIKDFMKSNVNDYSKVDYLDFYDVDSTRTIGDSLLEAMRQRTPTHFRRDIQYQTRQGKTLFLMRVRYTIEGDTCSATFYLDAGLTGVVAFKSN